MDEFFKVVFDRLKDAIDNANKYMKTVEKDFYGDALQAMKVSRENVLEQIWNLVELRYTLYKNTAKDKK